MHHFKRHCLPCTFLRKIWESRLHQNNEVNQQRRRQRVQEAGIQHRHGGEGILGVTAEEPGRVESKVSD